LFLKWGVTFEEVVKILKTSSLRVGFISLLLCEKQYQNSLKACQSLISRLLCFPEPTIVFTDSHNKGALSGASSKFFKK
jgi:hypothetical protein